MTSEERHAARRARRQARREQKRLSKQPTLESVFSFDNMYRAYRLCCNGVSWKASVQSYKANALALVRKRQLDVLSGNERPLAFVEFDICDRGKPRHIMSCHIQDRVSQRCLCDNCLVPMLSRSFIYDNGASLRGRGVDFSLDRLDEHLRRHYRATGSNDGYILFIDFKKFFANINHETAKAEFRKALADERLLQMAYDSIDRYGAVGVGLGAMTSQITALAVPNRLDHYVKEVLRIKGYGRYMDDVYCIHRDKARLIECRERIISYCNMLGIPINEKKTFIVKISKGFTFLKVKYSLTPTGAVIRRPCRKGITRMRRKLRKFKRWLLLGKMCIDDIVASISSWYGCMKRCRSYASLESTRRYFNDLFAGYANVRRFASV